MSTDPIYFRSATAIAKAIREGEISAVEMVELSLRRIGELNPKLNAVVTQCGERAIDEAHAADRTLARGEVCGVLHGVPITIKDSIETAGILTTAGTEGLKRHVPDRDACVVAALRGAGDILPKPLLPN